MAEIDKRTKQDILTALRERAASYTPEWHFDEKEPDIAAVLAMAYADMAAGTIKKLNGSCKAAGGTTPTPAAVGATLREGDQGEAVYILQARLFELGYYTGRIDGRFSE